MATQENDNVYEQIRRLYIRRLEVSSRLFEQKIAEIKREIIRLGLTQGEDFDKLSAEIGSFRDRINSNTNEINRMKGLSIEQIKASVNKIKVNAAKVYLENQRTIEILTTDREDLTRGRTESEAKSISAEKDKYEAEIYYKALEILGISEESADNPRYYNVIKDKIEELTEEWVNDLADDSENQTARMSMTEEEMAEEHMNELYTDLNYLIAETRQYSLAEAMGVQKEERVKQTGRELELGIYEVKTITELSDKDFDKMLESLGKDKGKYLKMGERRDKIMQNGNKPGVAEVISAIVAAAGMGGVFMANAMGANAESQEVANLVGQIGQVALAGGGATYVAAVIKKMVDRATKQAGVEAGKAVEKYLKEKMQVTENSEKTQNEIN